MIGSLRLPGDGSAQGKRGGGPHMSLLVLLLLTGLVFVRLGWAHRLDRESGFVHSRKGEWARVQSCVLGVGCGVSRGLCWVDVYPRTAG